MTTMATSTGMVRLPRSTDRTTKLTREQRLELAGRFLEADDKVRDSLISRWGKGRIRRSLLEFARHEHELEYKALRMREEV